MMRNLLELISLRTGKIYLRLLGPTIRHRASHGIDGHLATGSTGVVQRAPVEEAAIAAGQKALTDLL